MKRTNTIRSHHMRILLTACLIAWSAPAWGQWVTPSRTASRLQALNQNPGPFDRGAGTQGPMANPGMAVGQPRMLNQTANPFGDADRRPSLTLGKLTWTGVPPVERKPIAKEDTFNVLVDVSARASSDGEIDRRKKADSKTSLTDWTLLKGLTIFPDPQTLGDPTLGAKQDKKYRAEGGMETSESIKLSIQCRVVDIRDNGHLILEGYRMYQVNSEVWETYYIGTFRPEDMLPDNSFESRHGYDDRLIKRESGSVRDGYRIGWAQKLMDRFQF